MKRLRWVCHYFGGADVRYQLRTPDGRVLGGVMRMRHGEHWRAYIVTASAEPAVMARGRLDAGDGRYWTRGPAKHAVERAAMGMVGRRKST